jgi:hypothetical protein
LFREVLVNNLSIDNFINSDFAMLNDRLAKHYGIPNVEGPKVESFAVAPNFGRFDGFESFRELLIKNRHLVVRCVTEKMMTYALGRGLDFSDDETIDSITQDLQRHDQRLKTLVQQIVLSDAFHTN